MKKQKSILVEAAFSYRTWFLYFRTIEERQVILVRLNKQRRDFYLSIETDEMIVRRRAYLKSQVLNIPYFTMYKSVYKIYPYSIKIRSHKSNLHIQRTINHLIKDIDDNIQIFTKQNITILPCKEIDLV